MTKKEAGELLELGLRQYNNGNFGEAIETLEKIQRKDAPEEYALAQLFIGNIFRATGNTEDAINTLKKIHIEDFPDMASSVHFILGETYHKQGDIKDAIETLEKIKSTEDPITFTAAQFILGEIHREQGDTANAIKTLGKIKRKDYPLVFAGAQFSIGLIHSELKNLVKAIGAWNRIQSTDDLEIYTAAQIYIIMELMVYKDFDKMIKKWEDTQIPDEFNSAAFGTDAKMLIHFFSRIEEITHGIEKENDISKDLYIIYAYRELILESLFVKDTAVSHYTSIDTAKKIFEKTNKNKNVRLSLLTVSNDPTEGKIFLKYLDIPEEYKKKPKYPFGTCFTFKLDSLNQLRLYGKENNVEATGMALVVSPDFFNKERTFHQSLNERFDFVSVTKMVDEVSVISTKNNKENEIKKLKKDLKLPLYRCIYLAENEEKFDFICQVSAPSKATRFLQGDLDYMTDQNGKLNEKVKDLLIAMKESFTKLIENINNSSLKKEKQEELIDLIMDIILPVQYLIKDIAFQEERECRILKTVSDINKTDEKIQPDDAISSVYIDYEVPLDEHLEYAIIHEKQKTKAPYLERHLKTQVKISRNPYRR